MVRREEVEWVITEIGTLSTKIKEKRENIKNSLNTHVNPHRTTPENLEAAILAHTLRP